MINEQRWKTNYIALLEAGNCFYENVNCVCQADTERGGWGLGEGRAARQPRGPLISTLTTLPARIVSVSQHVLFNTIPWFLRPLMCHNFQGRAFLR